MMLKKVKKMISCVCSVALALTFIQFPVLNSSATENDPIIVVSLGDSYSSGEGIEPFYGQDKPLKEKVKDEDWLAHRSKKSWPSLLEIPGIEGTMKDYNVKQVNSNECKWYFGAVSGAETKHFCKENQSKLYNKSMNSTINSPFYLSNDNVKLPKQISIFDGINGQVDYVTLTVGGNDVGFVDIITTCATGSTYLHFGKDKLKLEKQMDDLWAKFDKTKANIKDVYNQINLAAGSADIIVAGYPQLLDKEGKGFLISKKEATIVNDNVTKFNNELNKIVSECRAEGMKIHFVDVEKEFDTHQAYSKNAWINSIDFFANSEDLNDKDIVSAYSVHPNEEGAKAYARCVNSKIKEIEERKNLGKIRLTYTSENDNDTNITSSTYAKNVSMKLEGINDPSKKYASALGTTAGYTYSGFSPGLYMLTITVQGYDTFTKEVEVKRGKTEYITIPLIKSPAGTLSGKICKASDRTTPIGGALINIYQNEELVKTIPSLVNGSYVTELPVGEYRVTISAKGYITFDAYVNVADENVTYLETFLLVDESDAASGNAYGQITNAITGKGLDDVALYVRTGWNNTTTVSVVTTTRTDSEGRYNLTLPLGNYTLYATKDGYVSNSFNIVVQENDTPNQNGTLTPIMSGESFRIVLTWGENPSDLDSHVEGKLSDSYPFHVYYSDMKSNDGSVTVCELDVDDTTSYGPETITLTPTTTDAYYYYVFRYSGSGTVAASGAQIKVYQGENLVRTFNVPTDLGSSDYWNVFAIKEGELIVRNTITESAELNYAE